MRYGAPEFARDAASGHRVVASVHVESRVERRTRGATPLDEIRTVGEAADRAAASGCRIGAAIVGYCDLSEPDAALRLDAMIAMGRGRFRGIRQVVPYEDAAAGAVANPLAHATLPATEMLRDPMLRRGLAALAPRDLIFEATVCHPQIDDVATLADAFPSTRFVLSHLGFALGIDAWAGRRDAVFADWRRSIRALARRSNVWLKVGGLGAHFWGFDFHVRPKRPDSRDLADAWRPWVETAVAAFGPGRALMESNFPVDRASTAYPTLWNALKTIIAGSSEAERDALFHRTAADPYNIALP